MLIISKTEPSIPLKLPLKNSYALLMIMLTPIKSPELQALLCEAAGSKKIQWEKILFQANLQMCTPLWYAQLKKDNFLVWLPKDLVEYLAELYQANLTRNQELQNGLIHLLAKLNTASIDTLLLKGAATFCDQLFDAPGSRFMGDLDILVPEDKVEQSREILIELGYQEIPNEGMERDELPTDERHHQLPRYYIPGTPIVVEIHFKISYAQVGRMIPPDAAWQSRIKTKLKGESTSVLAPNHKLLLNTAHALMPHREYLRGHISLIQLSEFTRLAQRYADSINWQNWIHSARHFSLSTEFMTYLKLSVNFMNLATPNEISFSNISHFNINRILFIGEYESLKKQNSIPFQTKTANQFYRLYYYARLPSWMWQNVCYAQGWKNIPTRILFCLKKLITPRSWKKV